jgi:hypothetical protein
MAARNPRLAVVLNPSTYQAIKELSEATGDSMSSIVAHFMDEAAPAFGDIAKAMTVAKARPIEALDLMAVQLAKATQAAGQGQLELVEARRRQHKRRSKA